MNLGCGSCSNGYAPKIIAMKPFLLFFVDLYLANTEQNTTFKV
jgi:hypothetical protein